METGCIVRLGEALGMAPVKLKCYIIGYTANRLVLVRRQVAIYRSAITLIPSPDLRVPCYLAIIKNIL